MGKTKGVTSRKNTGDSFNVAVDVGRSSVKLVTASSRTSFPFLIATKKSSTADYYIPADRIQKQAEVDGKMYFFGEEATLLGESVIQHTEGPAFKEASIAATLFSIAYMMMFDDDYQSKVNLAINLTFDNHYQKSEYAEALKGEHTVRFLREDEEITFTVEHVFVLYQGFSGLVSVAMDENFKVRKDYLSSEGVVVDVGRQTIDFLYVENMVVKAGSSKDFGTFKIYEKVVDLLKRKHSVVKEPFEIEEHLTENRPITLLDGGKIQLAPIVKEAVQFYFDDVLAHFSTFLSKRTPDYLLLLGGGALVYGPFFKEKFKLVEVPADPQFSNAEGMYRFLDQAISHNGSR